ncbi:MAG: chromosomal replication initiator protein DnaA [Dehalococcoidia bacterium]|nr:chromosomal replication initiator protein DnaA [Dehalococcoidia bacterium]
MASDSLRSAQDLWQAALGELELQVSRTNYRTWLQATTGETLDRDTLVVRVPNAFTQEWLEQRLRSHIHNTLAGLAGRPLEVRFSLYPTEHPQPPPPCPGLNPAFSFNSFAVGQFNLMAHWAATEAVNLPGQVNNPLMVWGGTGLGKTHLLQATVRRTVESRLSALYITAEQFTTQFISAIRLHAMESFRRRFLNLNLLVVDDIQFLTGKGHTQEGFFHTFNEMYNSGGQVMMAADRHPGAIEGLPDALCSRLSGGLVAHVTPPDQAGRLAILQARGGAGVDADPGVLEFVSQTPVKDIRQLLGRLAQVMAFARAHNRPPTPEMARQALAEQTEVQSPLIPQAIVATVLSHFRLPPDAFLSRKRHPQLSQARQAAIYLLREEVELSLSQIGSLVGGLTKSSVIYAYRQTVRSLPQSNGLSRPLAAILTTLRR